MVELGTRYSHQTLLTLIWGSVLFGLVLNNTEFHSHISIFIFLIFPGIIGPARMNTLELSTIFPILVCYGVESIVMKKSTDQFVQDSLILTCNAKMHSSTPRSNVEHAISCGRHAQCLAISNRDVGYKACLCPAEPNDANFVSSGLAPVLKLRQSPLPMPGILSGKWMNDIFMSHDIYLCFHCILFCCGYINNWLRIPVIH